jgi:hypothetical protein
MKRLLSRQKPPQNAKHDSGLGGMPGPLPHRDLIAFSGFPY